MIPIPPRQRRGLGATLLVAGLLVGLPRAWAAWEPAPAPQPERVVLGGPQVRVLLREAQALTVRAPAGGRLRLRDGAGPVLVEVGPDQPLRLQLAGSQVLALAEAGAGSPAQGSSPSGLSPAAGASPGPAPGPRPLVAPVAPASSAAAAPAFDSATGTPLAARPAAAAPAGSPGSPSPQELQPVAPGAGARYAQPQPQPQAQRLRVTELVVEPVAAPGTEGSVWLQKHRYRGSLSIRPQGDALQAVNLVGLETYLASVVGSEMPASWPLEALRAQAVAARTYALRALRPGSGRAYDLKSTVASQMYLGVEAETASTQAAVAATRGLVLTYCDGLIEAVFHSSSGGLTENSGELWAQQLPYLVSVADFDQDSPVRDWRVPLSDELVRRGMPEIGSLERIEVLSTSASGRVRQARVLGTAGSLLLSGAELRSRLGLKSTLVQFVQEPSTPPLAGDQPGPGSAPLAAGVPATSSASTAGLVPALVGGPQGGAVAAGAARPALGPTGPLAAAGTGTQAPPPVGPASGPAPLGTAGPPLGSPTSPGSDARLASGRLQWVAIGHGFGHGIGMSQWGALALARRGESFEQILQHYYRGTQLRPYVSLASLAPVLQLRLSLGPITARSKTLTLGATP